MYNNGQIVTLNIDKSHGDSAETNLYIKSGICGMVVEAHKSGDGDHSYVIDFGPEGQWNCKHNELNGNDQSQEEAGFETPEYPTEYPVTPESEEQLTIRDDALPTPNDNDGSYVPIPEEKIALIDPEQDIKRREKELEKGIKIK